MKLSSPLSAVVIATLAVFLTGCSRNPVAPAAGTTGAPEMGPLSVSVDPDGTPPSDGGTPLARTISLTATEDGVAVVGRFTLWVRKNSLKMPTTITLRVTDPEATDCQIDVSPAEANDFRSPVVLYANVTDLPGFDYSTGSLMTWDGNTWQWSTDTSSHPNQQNVVGHFSSLANTRVSDGADKWKNK